MNEIALSVSRQPISRLQLGRAALLRGHLRHRLILCCARTGVALLLTATTGRDADRIPAPTPASVVCVPVASAVCVPIASAVCAPVASAVRVPVASAVSAPVAFAEKQPPSPSVFISTAQVGNRFEPEYRIDDRAPLVLVSVPAHRAFSGPMWKFLLNGPVRPEIERMHNPTYYGVVVTIPFGG